MMKRKLIETIWILAGCVAGLYILYLVYMIADFFIHRSEYADINWFAGVVGYLFVTVIVIALLMLVQLALGAFKKNRKPA